MIPAYDHEGLWTKSVLFTNYAHDNDRVFGERAFWATLTLELLAKAALSKINPLLVADPTDDGKSQLIAAGVTQSASGFKSVAAKALFSRCNKVFPQFNDTEAQRLAISRNEYLHSALSPFEARAEDSWWERYWSLAVVLVTGQDRELRELVGPDSLQRVEGYLARNGKNTETRASALVDRARQRMKLIEAGSVSIKVNATFSGSTSYLQEYSGLAVCPACGASGEVSGDYEENSELTYDYGDEDEVWATEYVTVQSDNFSCHRCNLLLEGPDLVQAGGLKSTFEIVREPKSDIGEYMNE